MMQQMKLANEPTTAQEMQMTDTGLDSLTLNLQQTLSDLAEGTGGFLVANANDFGSALDRLTADIGSYYEIQYSPALVSFDGGFRRIAVKSPARTWSCSPGRATSPCPRATTSSCRTRCRSSWPCRRRLPGTTSRTRPRPCTSPRARGRRASVVVVGAARPRSTFTVDKKKKTFEQQLYDAAVVKDAEGRVVERFRRRDPLTGPLRASRP